MARVRLDHKGMRDMLKSVGVEVAIYQKAEEVAAAAEFTTTVIKNDAPIIVGPWNSDDRAGASVTIAHPGGLAMEAKHGPLTRAARSVGLGVKARKRARRRKKKPDADDVS